MQNKRMIMIIVAVATLVVYLFLPFIALKGEMKEYAEHYGEPTSISMSEVYDEVLDMLGEIDLFDLPAKSILGLILMFVPIISGAICIVAAFKSNNRLASISALICGGYLIISLIIADIGPMGSMYDEIEGSFNMSWGYWLTIVGSAATIYLAAKPDAGNSSNYNNYNNSSYNSVNYSSGNSNNQSIL